MIASKPLTQDARTAQNLIRAFAGETAMSDADKNLLAELSEQYRLSQHQFLVYHLAGEIYPASLAKQIWANILEHRNQLMVAPSRPPSTILCALDYLSNHFRKTRKAIGWIGAEESVHQEKVKAQAL